MPFGDGGLLGLKRQRFVFAEQFLKLHLTLGAMFLFGGFPGVHQGLLDFFLVLSHSETLGRAVKG